MAEYCTFTDVENRLTSQGVLYVADRDNTGTASGEEQTKYITPSIQYAGNLIDGYLAKQFGMNLPRDGANQWLRDRAIDIAAAKAAEVGGGKMTESMKDSMQYSISLLVQVADGGLRVPGLAYPTPANAPWITRTPHVVNPQPRGTRWH